MKGFLSIGQLRLLCQSWLPALKTLWWVNRWVGWSLGFLSLMIFMVVSLGVEISRQYGAIKNQLGFLRLDLYLEDSWTADEILASLGSDVPGIWELNSLEVTELTQPVQVWRISGQLPEDQLGAFYQSYFWQKWQQYLLDVVMWRPQNESIWRWVARFEPYWPVILAFCVLAIVKVGFWLGIMAVASVRDVLSVWQASGLSPRGWIFLGGLVIITQGVVLTFGVGLMSGPIKTNLGFDILEFSKLGWAGLGILWFSLSFLWGWYRSFWRFGLMVILIWPHLGLGYQSELEGIGWQKQFWTQKWEELQGQKQFWKKVFLIQKVVSQRQFSAKSSWEFHWALVPRSSGLAKNLALRHLDSIQLKQNQMERYWRFLNDRQTRLQARYSGNQKSHPHFFPVKKITKVQLEKILEGLEPHIRWEKDGWESHLYQKGDETWILHSESSVKGLDWRFVTWIIRNQLHGQFIVVP